MISGHNTTDTGYPGLHSCPQLRISQEENVAQRTVYFDDLDETEGAQPMTFALEGQEYQIDLSDKNAKRLRDALAEFIEKARPVERPPMLTLAPSRTTRRQGNGGTRDDIGLIRSWAESQGM